MWIKVQHGDFGAQAVGHRNGGGTNLAAADHDDACRLGARNARDQQTAAALGGQQVVGAFDNGKAASHLGHWSQQRQRTVAVGDRFIGNRGGIGLHQCLRQRAVRSEVKVGKDGKVRAQVLVLGLEWLLDFEQQFRLRPRLFR